MKILNISLVKLGLFVERLKDQSLPIIALELASQTFQLYMLFRLTWNFKSSKLLNNAWSIFVPKPTKRY